MNLVHAASIQKQQVPLPAQPAQAPQPVAANGHTPRASAHASEDAVVQQPAEQLERSGLVTSSLPEPLEQQVSFASRAFAPAPSLGMCPLHPALGNNQRQHLDSHLVLLWNWNSFQDDRSHTPAKWRRMVAQHAH